MSFYGREKQSIMSEIAYKFVQWEVPELEALKGSKVYELRERICRGESLTRAEKNWITEKVNTNSFFRRSIPLSGYCFDFSDVPKRYFVKQYDHIQEYYAMDKTSLRACLYGRVQEIYEVQ